MSLDGIWDQPIATPPKPIPADGDPSPQKRPRQSLFLSDSDSDHERPPKRATPALPPARPDVDALFEDLDKDEDDDLRYKPLAPALNIEKLAKEAEARHAHARHASPSQTLASRTGEAGGTGKDTSGRDGAKGKTGDGEKRGRKVLPKLDDERLVGPEGFPLLIREIKGFEPKGKGHEHADLNRLLQVYLFWTHKMYPKTSFKDTVNRVEKLCHSKRMQVRLSVWRDEFRGVTNDEKMAEDPDVIDLTEPTLVGTEDGDDRRSEDPPLKSDRASSHAPSLPPASSEAGDDDFDIDAVIRAEEERLATLRTATTDSEPLHTPRSPTLPEKVPMSNSSPEANSMDVDEASLWDAFDDQTTLLDPPQTAPSSSVPVGDDEAMWNIVDEMEQEQQPKPTKAQIPVSGVNLIPSLDSTNSGSASRATNDDDWDELYS